MSRPVMSAATRARLAAAAAERYARYLESDPMTPQGRFTRSPQAVASQHRLGRRQVERYRGRRVRDWEAEQLDAVPEPEPVVITAEDVEVALLIACNYVGSGGTPADALVIAAAMGIHRDAFGLARDMLDGADPELVLSAAKVYTEVSEWLGEWPK